MARKSKTGKAKKTKQSLSPQARAKTLVIPQCRIGYSRHKAKLEGNDKGVIFSLGTKRNDISRLAQFIKWLDQKSLQLKDFNPEVAARYLDERRQLKLADKTIKNDYQALKRHFSFYQIDFTQKVKVKELTNCRSYTPAQVALILKRQTDRNALSTEIAYRCGLRAHELFTLATPEEQPPDQRKWSNKLFSGREGVRYTVVGKGGLCREILMPRGLSNRLEKYRLTVPVTVTDRKQWYETRYDIAGGQSWSQSFSDASKRVLGWSRGAHGVRHTYAQERVDELVRSLFPFQKALKIVSEELGHFRPSITLTYLR